MRAIIRLEHFKGWEIDKITVDALAGGAIEGSMGLMGASLYTFGPRRLWKGVIKTPNMAEIAKAGKKAGFPFIRVVDVQVHDEEEHLHFVKTDPRDPITGQMKTSAFSKIIGQYRMKFDIPMEIRKRSRPQDSLDLKPGYDIDELKRLQKKVPNSLIRFCSLREEEVAGRMQEICYECEVM